MESIQEMCNVVKPGIHKQKSQIMWSNEITLRLLIAGSETAALKLELQVG